MKGVKIVTAGKEDTPKQCGVSPNGSSRSGKSPVTSFLMLRDALVTPRLYQFEFGARQAVNPGLVSEG